MSSAASIAVILVIAVIFIFLFFKIIRLPLKWLFKLALHAFLGFISLFILNFIGSRAGIFLQIDLLHSLIAGILGVPGVILMLLFKYLL